MKSRFSLLAGSAAVAGLLTLGVVGTALAADPTPVPGGGPRGPVAGAVDAVCQGAGWGFNAISETLQKLTGMKPEDVQAQRQAGKSVVQIAKEKGVAEDAVVKEVLAARKASLDEAVKAGRITQERADYMLNNMTENVKDGLNRTETGPRGDTGRMGGQSQRGTGQFSQGMGPGMGRWAPGTR